MWPFNLFFKSKNEKSSSKRQINRAGKSAKRSLEAGEIDRYTSDFQGVSLDPNKSLSNLNTAKKRARQLYIEDGYTKSYVKSMKKNVVGSKGINLVVKNSLKNEKDSEEINKLIYNEFKRFCKKQFFSTDKKLSFKASQKLFQNCLSVDGEALVLISRFSPNKKNPFGVSFKILSSNQLDISYNDSLKNREVRMGIEFDKNDCVTAYYLINENPENSFYSTNRERKRYQADRVIHSYDIEFAGQLRGMPPLSSGIKNINHLRKYNEAELISARASSCKMGFLISDHPEGYQGDKKLANGDYEVEISPGVVETLPSGYRFETFDVKHDAKNYESFKKCQLMGLASSLGISYTTLANDLENVNYSSIRQGTLDERETYKEAQDFLIEEFCEPVFEVWLKWQLLFGVFKDLKYSYEDLSNIEFKAKGFSWIDPQKEIQANKIAIESNMTTLTDVLSLSGVNLKDHLEKIFMENELFKKYGLDRNELFKENGVEKSEPKIKS